MCVCHRDQCDESLVNVYVFVSAAYTSRLGYEEHIPGQTRDWNEEIQTTRELARKNLPDRLLRERAVFKVHSDFVAAATRGAMAVIDGNVMAINPGEDSKWVGCLPDFYIFFILCFVVSLGITSMYGKNFIPLFCHWKLFHCFNGWNKNSSEFDASHHTGHEMMLHLLYFSAFMGSCNFNARNCELDVKTLKKYIYAHLSNKCFVALLIKTQSLLLLDAYQRF